MPAKKEREERNIIREERLSRPEKMALEEKATQPGAEYVEVGWRKTASEDLHTIHRRIDDLIGREGRAGPRTPPRTSTEDLPPGLRSSIVEAYGPVAFVRLAYSTKEHHVCRVGLREDDKVREIVVLVTPEDVRPVDTVEAAIDDLPDVHPSGVRITHTQFDAPGVEADNLEHEWVEITNRGSDEVDLTGWRLEDTGGHVFEFPEGFALRPRASVRVRTGEGKDSAGSLYWGRRAAVWNNEGDTARLLDADGALVHEVTWSPDDA